MAISEEMRKRLRKAAQMQAKWRDDRDELIRQASAAGASLREIAAIVDLSSTGVMKIINKGTSLEPPEISEALRKIVEERLGNRDT